LSDCPYCSASVEDAWVVNEYVIAIPPKNPATACHIVVAPRRHVPGFYDLDVQEQRMIWETLRELRERIRQSLAVEGFDAGFVDCVDEPAHTHVHLIARTAGETVERPSGAEWVALE
jgi:diadenosine tetraphosphate (Ap4A) HIT family hydrolase